VITPIEREHAAMLGGTIQSIASHKAGIIQQNGYAVTTPQVPVVEAVLRREAASQQASIDFVPISTLALSACTHLMRRGIIPTFELPVTSPAVHLPGRMEQFSREGKTLIIDGAHTLNSAGRLRATIEHIAALSPVHLIIGMLRDKSVQAFLAEFDDPRFHITLTQTSSHRALTPDEIQQTISVHQALVTIQEDLQTAVQDALQTSDALIVITGSLRMAALSREILGLLDAAELQEAQATRAIFEGQDYLSKLG
jgi:dihydrofolate synthase/folylpolyglutamate synthase